MLGYLCGYLRYHYPEEFLTAFLNNAANDDDIKNGTEYAKKVGIRVTMPKWGISKGDYYYDKDKKIITKGLASVKYMSPAVANQLYDMASSKKYDSFMSVLSDLDSITQLNARQLDILIKIDFFSDYGNQRELIRMTDIFTNLFKKGTVKKISKSKIAGSPIETIVKKYSIGVTKAKKESKDYTILDIDSILKEVEEMIRDAHLEDLSVILKVNNFKEALGYPGYISGRPEDRKTLYILAVFPARRRKDGKVFGYNVLTKSIGSGVESRFTVFNKVYDEDPIRANDIIRLILWSRDDRGYFDLNKYSHIHYGGV